MQKLHLDQWSNQAKVVYKRTYARKDFGVSENWNDTITRAIRGNIRDHNVTPQEIKRLEYFLGERKATPAGRGLWYSGSPSHGKLGGAALNNCWYLNGDKWENLVHAADLLMLGGGVGMSVEQRYISKLPKVKKGVTVQHRATKDASLILSDSREGWLNGLYRVLEAFLYTGKSFDYSSICIRGAGEPISGFGGIASGPLPLIVCIEKMQAIMKAREGKYLRSVDVADLLCCIGEMVVSGNVRRSAIIILGDPGDKDYLRMKRWDLMTLPSQRSRANFSVVCDHIDDLHPLFWETYTIGEAYGIVNRRNIRRFARMGELKKDTAEGVNPCGEATLESLEPCNLQELALSRLRGRDEFAEAARLMHRWGKRVTCERYHIPEIDEVVKRNRRIGTGITGTLESELFNPEDLNYAYLAILDEDRTMSKEMGIPESIRNTVVKPSGSISKVFDCRSEGIHGGFSRYMIQTIRLAANDPLIPLLKAAGHPMEPEIKLDGTLDHGTLVVTFYVENPSTLPCADEGWDTWKQLEVLKMAQKYWSDQAVSVTVYYKREEIPLIKEWLANNLDEIKSISFLCHSDHGYVQAPKQAITKEQYEQGMAKLKPLDFELIESGGAMSGADCEGGFCPTK